MGSVDSVMKDFLLQFSVLTWCLAMLSIVMVTPVLAHDPVFALGPHVLYKGGMEIAPELDTGTEGEYRTTEAGLKLTYGVTGDWAAGIALPYVHKTEENNNSGPGDASLFTKYRFWRKDSLGVQQSAAILARVKFDTSGDGDPPLGSGSTDGLFGLAYGYEGRKWYRWASARYRINGENSQGVRRGNKLFLDIVGGIRFRNTSYLEPDTVWLVELNGEYSERASVNANALNNSGGSEWFISPGIFWTLRNFAIKAGVQIPIASDLNGEQPKTDYRARLIFEWHL